MDARALLALVENLVERPEIDPQLHTNLRYILEALEGIHSRHRAPKSQPQDEELRQLFLRHLDGLYQGLADLDQALPGREREQLQQCLEQIRQAAAGLQALSERIENETEVSHETL